MPIKYTATDSRGRVHTRTSAADRVYTHAIVFDLLSRPGKPIVSFAGSRQLAEARRGEYKTATSVEIVKAVVVPPKGRKSAVAAIDAQRRVERAHDHLTDLEPSLAEYEDALEARKAAEQGKPDEALDFCSALLGCAPESVVPSDPTRTGPSSSLDAKAPRKPAEPRPSPAAVPASGPTGRTYNGLTQAYDYFNRELFDGRLPACLVTLQRKARTFGYYAADRFGNRDGKDQTDEIALNPSHFANRSTREVLSTLVHEMAHLARQRSGKPPRGGYHDKAWAGIMREVGLIPSNTGQPGGTETGQKVSHYIEQGGRFDLACARLEAEGFDLAYVELWDEQKAERAKKAAASKTKYTCPSCDANAWAKPEAKLVCGECDERMEG